jgi:hypothetical protein
VLFNHYFGGFDDVLGLGLKVVDRANNSFDIRELGLRKGLKVAISLK